MLYRVQLLKIVKALKLQIVGNQTTENQLKLKKNCWCIQTEYYWCLLFYKIATGGSILQ